MSKTKRIFSNSGLFYEKFLNNIKSYLYSVYNKFFNSIDERSSRLRINVILSFFYRGLAVGISFLIIPIGINYLDPLRFGIWLTLFSVIEWFNFLDIGLGNGLRNRFAEAIAKGEPLLAKKYVSTAYSIITLISILFFLFFFAIKNYLPWSSFLNAPISFEQEISDLVFFLILFFCIRFVLSLIITLLIANQKPAKKYLIDFFTQFLSIILILILNFTTEGSLLYLGLAVSISPVIVQLFFTFYYFKKEFRDFIPSFNTIDLSLIKTLFNLGVKFFIIQIAVVMIFSVSNIVIAHFLGSARVTEYNIVIKYFSIITFIFNIIVTPYWSANTEAYVKKDFSWIKRNLKILNKIALLLTLVTIIMIFISDYVYSLWIGETIKISFILTVLIAVYTLLNIFQSPNIYLLNGTGKVKIQMIISVFAILFIVPMQYVFVKILNFGMPGVILPIIFIFSIFLIFSKIQTKKIIECRDNGIWTK